MVVVVLTTCSFSMVGCVGHRHSNEIKGEVVLTLNRNTDTKHAIASEAVGALVGLTVDLVKAQVEAEAKKLERQYGQVDYRSDFWSIQPTTNTAKLKQNYSGFTLKRLTKKFPKMDFPAMEFDCSFQPSDSGRMFVVNPTKFVLRQAKAKVINWGGKINVTVNIAVDAMWIDKNQVAHQERIAFSSFDIADYNLSQTNTITNFKGQKAGWFPGVPISSGADGKYPWEAGAGVSTNLYSDGCFKLTVLVTEKDASKAKENLEKAAKFIGDQKSSLVDKAKKATD